MDAGLNKESIFAVWAPPEGVWSDWVKPVLFAHMGARQSVGPTAPVQSPLADFPVSVLSARPPVPAPDDLAWVPVADGRTVLVLDLPGAEAVWLGAELAQCGYRPVPLYNAHPKPDVMTDLPLTPMLPLSVGQSWPASDPATPSLAIPSGAPPVVSGTGWTPGLPYGPMSATVVDVQPVMRAIVAATPRLGTTRLAPEAPPAFLLDARRRGGPARPLLGQFDNRSVSLPSDFPSAACLARRGVKRALIVQRIAAPPQEDLSHTLLRWKEGGLELLSLAMATRGPAVPCLVNRPRWYGSIWYRVLETIGLRRHVLGGFGGALPEPSAGG